MHWVEVCVLGSSGYVCSSGRNFEFEFNIPEDGPNVVVAIHCSSSASSAFPCFHRCFRVCQVHVGRAGLLGCRSDERFGRIYFGMSHTVKYAWMFSVSPSWILQKPRSTYANLLFGESYRDMRDIPMDLKKLGSMRADTRAAL